MRVSQTTRLNSRGMESLVELIKHGRNAAESGHSIACPLGRILTELFQCVADAAPNAFPDAGCRLRPFLGHGSQISQAAGDDGCS